MKINVVPELAPPQGPYCHAVRSGNLLFISGQAPFNKRGEVVGNGMSEQTIVTMKNLTSVLNHCGLTLENVVKTTVYLTDIDEFSEMNTVYADFFSQHKPARATVEAPRLAAGILVEIEAVAEFPEPDA